MPSAWGSALLVIAAWIALGVGARSRAEDSTVAELLLSAAKKDIQKREYADAIPKLERTIREDARQIEAHYWIGFAREKNGDEAGALEAYRAFRHACTGRSAAAPLDTNLQGLVKKAIARLAVLAAGETELSKLSEAFVARAMAFARANFLREPALSERAARAILLVQPGHDDATKLLERIGGEPPKEAEPKGDPRYRGVRQWEDFIRGSVLGMNSGWSNDGSLLTIDARLGHIVLPPGSSIMTPSAFVYEMETRFLDEYPGVPSMGLFFAASAATHSGIGVHFTRTQAILWERVAEKSINIKKFDREPVDLKAWHKLTVVVSGRQVQVYFDDSKVIDEEVPGREHLVGQPGVYHQDSRAEVRVLRLGSKE